jgi:ribonuclease R
MTLPTTKIVQELRRFRGQATTVLELMAAVGLERDARRQLIRFLDALVIEGLLQHMRHGRYIMRRNVQMVSGPIQLQSAGHAFLSPTEYCGEQGGEGDGGGRPYEDDDLYLSRYRLMGAMGGDTVTALILPENYERRSRSGRRKEGLVIAVTQRAHGRLLGRCSQQRNGQLLFCSEPSGIQFTVTMTQQWPLAELDGKIAVLAIDRYPTAQSHGEGHIVELFGEAGDPQVDVKMAAYRQGIPIEFSSVVLREAEAAAVAVCQQDYAGRVDLCSLPLVTIDGADARDFDDAVALKELADGYRLWVAIADVSHYVQPDSAIDQAAWERGTSVYFPGSCIPMLPEVLSNGICSLNPNVERLVVALELEFDRHGNRTAMKAFPAVMKSHARLTYEQVQHCFDGGEVSGDDGGEDCQDEAVDPTIAAMIQSMYRLAHQLRCGRNRRGALDFDLPEADIQLTDAGVPHFVGRRTRLESHRLIEEFMLAANEAVASLVLEQRSSALFRVHDAPDLQSMQSLQQFVATFDMGFNVAEGGVQSHELLKLLKQAQGTEQEYTINRILLRSMKQARYDAENHGHFGLASEAYCHFTSPIRRYPDLIQHRLLLKLLAGNDRWPGESLAALADHTTTTERRAMLAERDIVDLRKCQFMEDKVGLRYAGFITAVTAFGFFVELNEFFIEGLVHIRRLGDDYYRYDPEKHCLIGQSRRQIFQVGNSVTVEVLQIQADKREIDFILPALSQQNVSASTEKRRPAKHKNKQGGRHRTKGRNRR